MKKYQTPGRENFHLYRMVADLDIIIDAGDYDMEEFYILHRDDKKRIDECLTNLHKLLATQMPNNSLAADATKKSIRTLEALKKKEQIMELLEEGNQHDGRSLSLV